MASRVPTTAKVPEPATGNETDVGLDPGRMFRLPWTASDNAMTWFEPTRRCNITCDACFVTNDRSSDKSLAEIEHELDAVLRLRRCDALLVAGGEPLVHPEIVEIVRRVHRRGVKPVVITNGVRLDRPLLRELVRAGAHGFTFHVDSHQHRPGWKDASESELNQLRAHFADMLREEGRLTCAFNTTVFPDTLDDVPAIVDWAVSVPDRVHVLTLIAVRMLEPDSPFEFWVGDAPIDVQSTPYVSNTPYSNLTTSELTAKIREILPDFRFCAYLGGTVHPHALKWVIGVRIGSSVRGYGYLGARSMELLQNGHHALRGRYLAFSDPRSSRSGRAALLLGTFDRQVRRAAAKYGLGVVRSPRRLLERVHLQSISVVQPVDLLPNGEADTCDGCPNRTFWEERLVPACKAEEYRLFGGPMHAVPRTRVRLPIAQPGFERREPVH